ncbi:4-carboxymuconolactone decarboxylase [Desulfosarcina widdelii]|uniref:4-carboxymuconolactone decarboxylase n=1 Tax=Desulfosarcina widdelii TaxID=947919 RepID=A0A5K7Z3N6_9BACT|nr:carboxymuconolactone decarboxylase family protein [Desulfosarcina widdelii]BBO74583.1 4-carboxymuconolactone decarboxylase [Desulfosarcina widdelii]
MKPELTDALASLEEGLPSVMEAFRGLQAAATSDGTLDAKTKKLMMVAVTAALRCEPCLREQVKGALQLGASREEILEAAGVAILIGGGPTAAYCALYLMDELNNANTGGQNGV